MKKTAAKKKTGIKVAENKKEIVPPKPKGRQEDLKPSKTRSKAKVYDVEPILRPAFYKEISDTLQQARGKAYKVIDALMVQAYWQVGRRLVEEEQQGSERANYGSALLYHLSIRLKEDFGPGFTERNLSNFRRFYLCFPIRCAVRTELETPSGKPPGKRGKPVSKTKLTVSKSTDSEIRYALRTELSWTHYRALIRVENATVRHWYMNEAAGNNWSSRALERQIQSFYYERLLSSRDQRPVIAEMFEKTAALAPSPRDFIRDPVVLEFLDLQGTPSLRESTLEQAIINKLQQFLLELGKGFAFVARQQRVSTQTKDFYVDLVFYNFILKCFVLIDLKMGELNHADIGQMDMYIRLYEDQHKRAGDNPTVGLILCTEKDHTVVKYSILKESQQIFASKYQFFLPSEQELQAELEREREQVLREDPFLYGVS